MGYLFRVEGGGDFSHQPYHSYYLLRVCDDLAVAISTQHGGQLVTAVVVVDSPDVLRHTPLARAHVHGPPSTLQRRLPLRRQTLTGPLGTRREGSKSHCRQQKKHSAKYRRTPHRACHSVRVLLTATASVSYHHCKNTIHNPPCVIYYFLATVV